MKTASEMLGEDFGTIGDLIRAHAAERPAAIALINDEHRVDYARLDQLMDRVAAGLQRDGLRPGNTVAICAATSIEYCAVFLGALRAGMAVAPLAPSGTPDSIASMVRDSDAKIFLLDATLAAALERAELPHDLAHISLDDDPSAGEPLREWMAPSGTRPTPVTTNPGDTFNTGNLEQYRYSSPWAPAEF